MPTLHGPRPRVLETPDTTLAEEEVPQKTVAVALPRTGEQVVRAVVEPDRMVTAWLTPVEVVQPVWAALVAQSPVVTVALVLSLSATRLSLLTLPLFPYAITV
jgi:hypothetical protein